MLANPPYLPATGDEARDDRWDAGPDGRAILDRIIDGARGSLKPGGRLVLVQSALASIDATRERLHQERARGHTLRRAGGALGSIAMARRESLVRIGALEHGSPLETLVAFTARPMSQGLNS